MFIISSQEIEKLFQLIFQQVLIKKTQNGQMVFINLLNLDMEYSPQSIASSPIMSQI